MNGDLIFWELEGHGFEFTPEEFEALLSAIRNRGLFSFLSDERSTILDRIRDIYPEYCGNRETLLELEHRLEQTLIELDRKIG